MKKKLKADPSMIAFHREQNRAELARLEKLERDGCTALECLPVCPVCGVEMTLQKPGTYEQRFVGTSYGCLTCNCSTIYPSKELLRFLIEL